MPPVDAQNESLRCEKTAVNAKSQNQSASGRSPSQDESASDWLEPPFFTPPLAPSGSSSASSSSGLVSSASSPHPSRTASKTTLRSAFVSGGQYLKSSILWAPTSAKNSPSSKSLRGPSSSLSPKSPALPEFGASVQSSPAGSVSNIDLISDAGQSTVSRDSIAPLFSRSPSLLKKLSKSNLRSSLEVSLLAKPAASSGCFLLRKTPRGAQEDKLAHHGGLSIPSDSRKPVDTTIKRRSRDFSSRNRPVSLSAQHLLTNLSSGTATVPQSMAGCPASQAFKRPPMLRRDRPKSVSDVELLLASPVEELSADPSGFAGSATANTHAVANSTHSVHAVWPDGRKPSTFQLPDIQTSHCSSMDSRERSLRARSTSSFKWSRVLGRKNDSASGKRSSQDLGATADSRAGRFEGEFSSDLRGTSIVQGSKTSMKTVQSRKGLKVVKSSSDLSFLAQKVTRPLPTLPGHNDQDEQSGPSKSVANVSGQSLSRRSIPGSSPTYSTSPSTSEPRTEFENASQATSLPQAHRVRQESENCRLSHPSPLSPNLASLWSSAVEFSSEQGSCNGDGIGETSTPPSAVSSPARSSSPQGSLETAARFASRE